MAGGLWQYSFCRSDRLYAATDLQRSSIAPPVAGGKQQFIIARLDGEPVGYASWSLIEEPGVYKLHKLYVVPSCQGKGIGIQMVRYILDQLPPGATALRLHVNRYNPARYFYEKCGFTIIAQADIPIGEGIYE